MVVGHARAYCSFWQENLCPALGRSCSCARHGTIPVLWADLVELAFLTFQGCVTPESSRVNRSFVKAGGKHPGKSCKNPLPNSYVASPTCNASSDRVQMMKGMRHVMPPWHCSAQVPQQLLTELHTFRSLQNTGNFTPQASQLQFVRVGCAYFNRCSNSHTHTHTHISYHPSFSR